MRNNAFRRGFLLILGFAVPASIGCDNPSGPSAPVYTVTGAWGGQALLPNSAGTDMTLQQNGSAVTGTMTLTGGFRDKILTGTFSMSTRTFNWTVNNGCELWSGVLTMASSAQQMAGSIRLDASGCGPNGKDASGTLTLNR